MTEKNAADLNRICKKLCAALPAKQIYLFGSYAYGQPSSDSDYDLYIVIPDGGLRPIEAMKRANLALYKSVDIPVDVIVGTESDFNTRRNGPTLERTISMDGVLLYGETNGFGQAMEMN